jgi:hypothetical protein
MLNLIIHTVYFDDCDGELDPVPMAHFNIDDKGYDMVPLNDDFTLDQMDKQTVKAFNQADINAINIAIKAHIKNEQKLDETNEKINNLILAILEKTNHELRLLKKNDSYIISELDREKNKWNIMQMLSSRMQTEMYLENLLNSSKKVVKRLNANISEYLHDSFRVKCQENKLDMQEVLEEMIRDYIK